MPHDGPRRSRGKSVCAYSTCCTIFSSRGTRQRQKPGRWPAIGRHRGFPDRNGERHRDPANGRRYSAMGRQPAEAGGRVIDSPATAAAETAPLSLGPAVGLSMRGEGIIDGGLHVLCPKRTGHNRQGGLFPQPTETTRHWGALRARCWLSRCLVHWEVTGAKPRAAEQETASRGKPGIGQAIQMTQPSKELQHICCNCVPGVLPLLPHRYLSH